MAYFRRSISQRSLVSPEQTFEWLKRATYALGHKIELAFRYTLLMY